MKHPPLLLLVFILLPWRSYAQDAASWSGLAYEKEVSDNWAWEAEVEYRRTFSEPETDDWLMTFGVSRALADRLNLATAFRYRVANEGKPAEGRGVIDLSYAQPIGNGPFQLESRMRYQREYPLSGPGGAEVAVRPRLGIAWELTEKWEVVAEWEYRYRFDDRNAWSSRRQTYGLARPINERWEIDLFYRREADLNRENPGYENIIGVFLRYSVPRWKGEEGERRRPFRRLVW